jgi:hypothetical protein
MNTAGCLGVDSFVPPDIPPSCVTCECGIKETKILVDLTCRGKMRKTRAIYKILKQIKAEKNTNDWRKFKEKNYPHQCFRCCCHT